MLAWESSGWRVYKHISTSRRLLAVVLERQSLPGSFAHAVHHRLDHDFDLSGFDARHRNDSVGASVTHRAC